MSATTNELWERLQAPIDLTGDTHPESINGLSYRLAVTERQRDAALELISRSANLWLRFSRFRYRVYRWRKQGTPIWAQIGRGGRRRG